MNEYVTVNLDKRNLGLKGLEFADIILAFLGLFLFLFLVLVVKSPMLAIYISIIYIALLAPIQLSNKNRVYKIVFMLIIYIFNKHIFIYQKFEKEGVLNESYQKLKEIKNKIRQRINDKRL